MCLRLYKKVSWSSEDIVGKSNIADAWRADELYVKVRGNRK